MSESPFNASIDELRYYALETIRETLAKAASVYGRTFPMPLVTFDLRGRTAGRASYKRNVIRLNAQLFGDNQSEFIKRTIPHEVAHLISFQLYGTKGRGHKACWRSVMVALGVKDITRCHKYITTPARNVRRWDFACNCGAPHRVTTTKRNRLLRNPYAYVCRRCGSKLLPC